MNIGDLRHCIELKENVRTGSDSRGQDEFQYVKRALLKAKFEYLRGNEALAFQQQYSAAIQRITTRYVRGVNPKTTWQIHFNGRVFEIISIENVEERNQWWVFTAAEKV